MSGHGYYRTGANANPAKARERYASHLMRELAGLHRVTVISPELADAIRLGIAPEPTFLAPPVVAAPEDIRQLAPTELGPAMSARDVAKGQGYTGDQCSTCNSMRMKNAGHCQVCEDCGTTTGCS